MIPRDALGRLGEEAAAERARERGWEIAARNAKLAGGEIDLVALDGDTVVFVEVKARRGARLGSGGEAVTPEKMRRVARASLAFLQKRGWLERPCRGDVCVVSWRGGDGPDASGSHGDGLEVEWLTGAMPLGEYL